MENWDVLGFLIVTLNCNVTLLGKVWLLFTLLLRIGVLVGAGYPIFRDEQERFVCNTLQPGCAAVCFDLFSPVSPPRLWLAQSLALLLPGAAFGAYAVHRGARAARGRVPDLSGAYAVQLALRTALEAAAAAAQYLLLGAGAAVPAAFPCARPPCAGAVACYVARPTERALAARCAWAACALSLLLSLADLAGSLRRRARGAGRGSSGRGAGARDADRAGAHLGTGARDADCASAHLGTGARDADRAGAHLGTGARDADRASAHLGTGARDADCAGAHLGTGARDADRAGAHLGTGARDADRASAHLGTGARDADRASAELPDAAESEAEAASSARDRSARAPGERRGPAAPRSHLAALRPGLRASSGSAPHLRTNKSEWV